MKFDELHVLTMKVGTIQVINAYIWTSSLKHVHIFFDSLSLSFSLSLSLAIRPYRPSLRLCNLDGIHCPNRTDKRKLLLVS